MTPTEERIANRFPHDVASHVMTVLHDDGLYRHLRFAAPGWIAYWFEIVTWPGSLTIHGDIHGAYTFISGRVNDMFAFFRGDVGRINPEYWAESLPDHGKSAQEYNPKILKGLIENLLADYEPTSAVSPSADEVRQRVAEYETDGLLEQEDGARVLLRELEQDGVLPDSWGWDLTDWRWTYLWTCHAIVWGIARYDASKRDQDHCPEHTKNREARVVGVR